MERQLIKMARNIRNNFSVPIQVITISGGEHGPMGMAVVNNRCYRLQVAHKFRQIS